MFIPRPTDPVPQLGPPITRNQIIERAKSWLRPTIVYSQSEFHENEYGIYRTDCSGYVSMAWALPGWPLNKHGGLDTISLAMISQAIAKHDLLAGDILIRTEGTNLTRHVAMFEKWLDEGGKAYWGFEQAGGRGTIRRTINYPYDNTTTAYRPSRYVGIVENRKDKP